MREPTVSVDMLPHRPPFLFLDRIITCENGICCAERTFRADEEFFKGHFPGRPIVPGVLMLEGMAQTMACLAIHTTGSPGVYLVGVNDARFRKMVHPGQTVTFRVEYIAQRLGVFVGRAEAHVEGVRVASAELRGMLER